MSERAGSNLEWTFSGCPKAVMAVYLDLCGHVLMYDSSFGKCLAQIVVVETQKICEVAMRHMLLGGCPGWPTARELRFSWPESRPGNQTVIPTQALDRPISSDLTL